VQRIYCLMLFTVFTKPWNMPWPELAKLVVALGYDGVEVPVRPGCQIEPDNVTKRFPEVVTILAEYGLKIGSVAGEADESTIIACGLAGVPCIRICVPIPKDKDYLTAIADYQRHWETLTPALDNHGVILGIQNHCNRNLANAMQLYHALQPFDPKHVGAVWDPCHCTLDGEIPELALDLVWTHLCMVNLKNVMWRRMSRPEDEAPQWDRYWTCGSQGMTDWSRVAQLLKQRGWDGNVCLTAIYSDHESVDRLAADDLKFAKACFAPSMPLEGKE